ncbi:hypothetical protein EHQ58_08090 [Leptospira ognonensis]|uniref:Uncharacterized protein n=1 Tax=Leptospira ognonensis TaxID=2484945 RepID=A0A4R9K222_9LEPT|nr:hypothetical protein EHQ58_08090 [Leptospira ognonensis]
MKTPLQLLLNSILLICAVSAPAETAHSEREKLLDKEILSLYKELSRARELLSYENIISLPNNTTVNFIGKYPNRTGVRIRKFLVDTDPGNKSKMRTSDEKSILLEFNGTTLSKIEISVITEDVQIQQKTKTRILDLTPLDDNVNDMELNFNGLDGSNKFLLSDLSNDPSKSERNDFKKDFYIKFLLDFHSQISSILASQKERGLKGQKNMLQQLNGSLKY